MNELSVTDIPLLRLVLAFTPAIPVIFMMRRWSLPIKRPLIALLRMLVQLLLVGFVLVFLIESDSAGPVLAMLSIMVLTASWISLRTAEQASQNRAVTELNREAAARHKHAHRLLKTIESARRLTAGVC